MRQLIFLTFYKKMWIIRQHQKSTHSVIFAALKNYGLTY